MAGAMVRLVDDQGDTRSGWITREDGRFRLESAPGTYDLIIERIGFDRMVIEGLDLVAEEITNIDVSVETAAIRLAGLTVKGSERGCPRIDEGEATQVLWEEARKALTAAAWTERQSRLRFNVLQWDRFIDATTGDVIREDWYDHQWVGRNSVTSLPPEDLEAGGYVRSSGGNDHYYGPDAQSLLSPSFLNSHCFRVVRPEEPDSHLIGLEFEPVPGRELPDVRGTIWVDEKDARLEKVEFMYTGLRGRVGRAAAEGEVRFAELTGGRWFVRDWYIRVPRVERRGSARDPFRLDVMGFHDVGSLVEQVRGEGIAWTSEMARGSIAGAIFDSVSGRPLSRAEVRIAGRPSVVADALGRFEIARLPPGEYRVSFAHPRMDSLGVASEWTTVTVASGSATEVPLVVPSWETLVERQCGSGGSIVGRVSDEQDRPLPGAQVTMLDESGAEGIPVQVIADQMGVYALCRIAIPNVVTLAVQFGAATSNARARRSGAEDHVRADIVLTLARPELRPSPGTAALRPALVGEVLQLGTRLPLEGALVELVDSTGASVARALSDADGVFRILLDDGGNLRVRIERLGYASVLSEPLDLTGGARRVEVLLPEEAIEIEPIVVVIERRVDKLELEGFYARALTRSGMFMRRDDVYALDPLRASDLLARVPGILVRSFGSSGLLRQRVVFRNLALSEGRQCWASLFIDGELVQMGGVRNEALRPGEERLPGERVIWPLDERIPKSVDEFVRPEEIEAIEMYRRPELVPRRFVGLSPRCGAIVIWTREAGDHDPGPQR